jgi:hypothetical protein
MLADMREREKEMEMENRPRKLPMEYDRPELPPRLVPVSSELAREIREKGRAYRR